MMSTFRVINKTRSLTSFRSLRYIYNTSKLSATPTTEHNPSSSRSSTTNPESQSPLPSPIIKGTSISKQIKLTSQHSLKLHPKFGRNQNLPIDHEFNERLRRLLNNFHAPIRYAIAYGSGVF